MQLLESSNILLHLGKTGSCYRGTIYYTVLVNLAHHLTGADRHKVMLKNLESASSSSKTNPEFKCQAKGKHLFNAYLQIVI